MNNESIGTKTLAFQESGTMNLYRFAFLSVLVLASPLVFSQPITGSFVNAALFLSAVFFGFRKESFAIAIVPSLVAISTGQLPMVFAPLVPFIMAGNLLLVFLADRGFRKGSSSVVIAVSAAFAKAALLFVVGGTLSLTLFRGTQLAGTVFTMFGWLQLATALVGATIAFSIVRILRGRI